MQLRIAQKLQITVSVLKMDTLKAKILAQKYFNLIFFLFLKLLIFINNNKFLDEIIFLKNLLL